MTPSRYDRHRARWDQFRRWTATIWADGYQLQYVPAVRQWQVKHRETGVIAATGTHKDDALANYISTTTPKGTDHAR